MDDLVQDIYKTIEPLSNGEPINISEEQIDAKTFRVNNTTFGVNNKKHLGLFSYM